MAVRRPASSDEDEALYAALLGLGQQVAGALQRNLTVYPGWAGGGMGMTCGVDDDIDIFRCILQGIGSGQITLEQVY
jgi:hypothetical protein